MQGKIILIEKMILKKIIISWIKDDWWVHLHVFCTDVLNLLKKKNTQFDLVQL